jgi:hypothetical protein
MARKLPPIWPTATRASGKPGVCAQMIGASNLAAGLRDGYMAAPRSSRSPAARRRSHCYRHAYQEVDDVAQFDAVTKFNAQIDHVSRMPDLLRQAFGSRPRARPVRYTCACKVTSARSPRRRLISIRWWKRPTVARRHSVPRPTCSRCARRSRR